MQHSLSDSASPRERRPYSDHPGSCPVPWTLISCRFDDLDPEERADWAADFAKDRARTETPPDLRE
jgi:hypothetical protein